MIPPTNSQQATRHGVPSFIPQERELWRGQPEWIGYVSTLAAFVAVPTVLLAGWVGKPGARGVLGIAGLALNAAAVAYIVYAGWKRTGYRYRLTTSTFYYVELAFRRSRRRTHTIPLAAIARVELRQKGWQRLLGLGNLYLIPYTVPSLKDAFRLQDISEPERALELVERQLDAIAENAPDLFPVFGAVPTEPAPREFFPLPRRPREAFLPLIGIPVVLLTPMLLGLFLWARPDKSMDVQPHYASNDPIYFPDGGKRPRPGIMRYMENEVMPFAKRALAPIVGGAENVTCETCHGKNPKAKNWRMPGVIALPHTRNPGITTKLSAQQDDIQLHNALVGEASDYDKANTAEIMRRIVLPKMAALLHRPVYDRSRPYVYNKERAAFGCYHCHRLHQGESP